MKVGIDISPLKSGHKVRGIGSYTENLINEFKKNIYDAEFEFFENPDSPPSVDITHYPYFDLFFKTLPQNKPSKQGRIVTIHDVIPLIFPMYFPAGIRGYIRLFFQKMALKNVDVVLCNSNTSKEDIHEKLGIPKEKIKITYLAAGENFKKIYDNNKLKKTINKFNIPKQFALYVGDVNWNKNIEGLIKAIKISKVPLVMVGAAATNPNLQQAQMINNLIKEQKVEKLVQKTGYIDKDDLVNLYNLATVTVLPSHYEGFGFPVLESAQCGTPVVCSNIASLSEIGAGVAIFCDPSNPEDIAGKITHSCNLSSQSRKDLSEKLIKHASQYSWKKVAEETLQIYKEVYTSKVN